jgi:hypothetical protein
MNQIDFECKSCAMYYDVLHKLSHYHDTYTKIFYCLVCKKETQAFSHIKSTTNVVECASCHNYILYFKPLDCLWKDEIYIDKFCLIRVFENNKTYLFPIFPDAAQIAMVDGLFEINDMESLRKKIKTIMVFS